MQPSRIQPWAITALCLLLCTGGCQRMGAPAPQRIAELKQATATGGQMVAGGLVYDLTPEQAAEAREIIVYCLEVRPARSLTSFPERVPADYNIRLGVDLVDSQGAEDRAFVGYYIDEQIVYFPDGSFNSGAADDKKILEFVERCRAEQAAAASTAPSTEEGVAIGGTLDRHADHYQLDAAQAAQALEVLQYLEDVQPSRTALEESEVAPEPENIVTIDVRLPDGAITRYSFAYFETGIFHLRGAEFYTHEEDEEVLQAFFASIEQSPDATPDHDP